MNPIGSESNPNVSPLLEASMRKNEDWAAPASPPSAGAPRVSDGIAAAAAAPPPVVDSLDVESGKPLIEQGMDQGSVSQDADPSGTVSGEVRHPTFHGKGGTLLGIHFVNMLLTMLTFGIYMYWAKVKVRSFMLSQTEFEGDRFEYHGTGKELLRGWSKALVMVGIPMILLNSLPALLGGGTVITVVTSLVFYALLAVFIPVVMVSARRYRMSRTSWRGIRFSFQGQVRDFIKLFLKGAFLTVITLGFYRPIFETNLHDFKTAHTYFGTERFEFNGNGRDLYRPFLIALLLLPFTFGISWVWYIAARNRCFWNNTVLGEARLQYSIKGGDLFLLYLVNLLLLIFTFGIAYPWVSVRTAHFHMKRLSLQGPLDLARIQQDARSATATGEELAGFFDLDLGWA